MLDIKFIRQNAQQVQAGNDAKGFKVDVSQVLALDDEIRPMQQELEQLQAERNKLSQEIPKAQADKRELLKKEVLAIKVKMESLEAVLNERRPILNELLLKLAQPAGPDVPFGKDDKENVEVRKWGDPRKFAFSAKDHIAIGEKLGILDFERGVKVAGSRSYILKRDGALLEQAVLRFGYDFVVKKGFAPHSVPLLVKEEAMIGTGYFPVGRDQAYFIEKDKLALIGTSEVSLCSMHANEMLTEEELPLRYTSLTTCFRREAGTYGKDTRGLYRVHQFNKIEMVVFAVADAKKSEEYHHELLSISEGILQALELPYRVVYVCTGDLGQGQVRKHDIETWMPSRNGYGETHSCSTFHDFQARRLNIRYKTKDGQKAIAYTLNNTALAIPRILLALLENFQEADGSVSLPSVLHPYMMGKTRLRA